MTDAQLALFLSGLLDDLERALDDTRERMPEDAEREQETHWRVKEEFKNDVFAYLTMAKNEEYTISGDFAALGPLVEFVAKWRERVDVLMPSEAAKEDG